MVKSLMFLRAQFTPSDFVRKATAGTAAWAEAFSGEVGGNCRRAPELCRSIGTRAVQCEPAHGRSLGSRIGREARETDRPYLVIDPSWVRFVISIYFASKVDDSQCLKLLDLPRLDFQGFCGLLLFPLGQT